MLKHTSQQSSITFLKTSTKTWFYICWVGQLIFATYIFALYGLNGLSGNFEKWNEASPHGYTEGDMAGNIIFGIHVILAGIVTIGGPIQLEKHIRNRFPIFHKITGRIYVATAFLISVAGLYLAWFRKMVGGEIGVIFISINGLLIMTTAFFTIRFALKRDFRSHRKWAIRLFLCMSGVWFFRIFVMLWFTINQGPVGIDPETFTGPAINLLNIISYIVPILFVQLYFNAVNKGSSFHYILGSFMIILSISTAIGCFAATVGMWMPSLQ